MKPDRIIRNDFTYTTVNYKIPFELNYSIFQHQLEYNM